MSPFWTPSCMSGFKTATFHKTICTRIRCSNLVSGLIWPRMAPTAYKMPTCKIMSF